MTRTLKSIVALVAVAVIVGQAGTEQRAGIEPRNRGLPLLLNSEATRVLVRACGNCHSNRTDWPWYSHVAPVSWWIARHVREGREKLDFSKWETYSGMAKA
jgi:Haem-binding domain